MGKTGSYIKLDRGLKNNSLWLLEKPFTKGQAWIDLLILAQGIDKSREHKGKVQKLSRGNVYTSIYFLSSRWGWGRMKVYRFLEKLMMDEMIEVQGWKIDDTTLRTVHRDKTDTTNDTTSNTVISIVNWDLYQCYDTTDDTTDRPVRCAEVDTTDRTHNIIYTDNDTEKERNIPPISPKGDSSPSGEKQKRSRKKKSEWDNDHAETMMPRDMGKRDDIPVKHRDGTYHSFETYAEYWDWMNQ